MRNLKRTTTAVALSAGLSLAAVAPAVADSNSEDTTGQQHNQVVRDVQGSAGDAELAFERLFGDAGGNDTVLDLLGIGDATGTGDNALGNLQGNPAGNGNDLGNGALSGNEAGNGSGNGTLGGNDVGGVGNGNHTETGDVDVDPQVDPHVEVGGDESDVVDDDSRTSERSSERTSDDDQRVERDRQEQDGDREGLLGGLL